MGNECCQEKQNAQNMEYIADEFYDPYTELKQRMTTNQTQLQYHGPKYLPPLPDIPHQLAKLEIFINQQVPPPKMEHFPESVVLPPF
jgi:hypothetical protein